MMLAREKPWIYGRGARLYELVHRLNTLWTDSKFRKVVVKEARIGGRDRVLDIGTGTGLAAIEALGVQPDCSITGIDISPAMLKQAQKNIRRRRLKAKIELTRCDAANLPFESGSFNRVISCYGLGGVKDIRGAFRELVRVAAPDAVICVAEIVEPPPEYRIKRLLHKYFAGPLFVEFLWGFRDLDLLSLFRESGIKVTKSIYFTEKAFGSTMLVIANKGFDISKPCFAIGVVEKSGTGKESC